MFNETMKIRKFGIDKDKSFNLISKVFDLIERAKKIYFIFIVQSEGGYECGHRYKCILYNFYFCVVFFFIQCDDVLFWSKRIANNGYLHLITHPKETNTIQRQENETEIKYNFSSLIPFVSLIFGFRFQKCIAFGTLCRLIQWYSVVVHVVTPRTINSLWIEATTYNETRLWITRYSCICFCFEHAVPSHCVRQFQAYLRFLFDWNDENLILVNGSQGKWWIHWIPLQRSIWYTSISQINNCTSDAWMRTTLFVIERRFMTHHHSKRFENHGFNHHSLYYS